MKFNYYMPTRIVAGADCLRENAAMLAGLGKRAFVMTGGKSAAASGALADLEAALKQAGLAWKHFAGVKPNPSLQDVRAAAAEARAFGADCVLAIGGGSPMDAAKAVAVLAAGEVSDQDLLGKRAFDAVLPLAAVPTTSGTGSEVTQYSILTNDALETKSFLNAEQVFPRIAFLDARYTLGLPRGVTAATVVDALSHAVESYLAVRSTPIGRIFALESLRTMAPILEPLAAGAELGLDQRERLLYASTLAGVVISQSGTTAVHAMGYSLTYFKGVDHGAANGLLMGEYLRFVARERAADVGLLLGALGLPSVDALAALLARLVPPAPLSPAEVAKFAAIAIKAGNIQNTNPKPSLEDLENILRKSLVK